MVPSQILASNQIVTKISQSDKKLAYLAQAHIGTKPNIPILTQSHKIKLRNQNFTGIVTVNGDVFHRNQIVESFKTT